MSFYLLFISLTKNIYVKKRKLLLHKSDKELGNSKESIIWKDILWKCPSEIYKNKKLSIAEKGRGYKGKGPQDENSIILLLRKTAGGSIKKKSTEKKDLKGKKFFLNRENTRKIIIHEASVFFSLTYYVEKGVFNI